VRLPRAVMNLAWENLRVATAPIPLPIVGYGKLGGKELATPRISTSFFSTTIRPRGGRGVRAFRLAHQYWLTTLTSAGVLYETICACARTVPAG